VANEPAKGAGEVDGDNISICVHIVMPGSIELAVSPQLSAGIIIRRKASKESWREMRKLTAKAAAALVMAGDSEEISYYEI